MSQNRIFLFISFIFLIFSLSCSATPKYDFNKQCSAAYEALMSFKINEGKRLLQKEMQENPENLIPVYLENYADCLQLLFNGSNEEYKRWKPNKDIRLRLLEKGDENSPWYLYCKAGLYFQWAVVRLRFNEFFNGGTEFRKSFLYLKENHKKFPDFKYNLVLLGLEESIVSTIPDNYKWIASMLGMKGNLKGGMAKINHFLNDQSEDANQLRIEATFYQLFTQFYLLSEKEQVLRQLSTLNLDTKNNLTYTFMYSNLTLDAQSSEKTLHILNNRNQGPEYIKLPLFDYQMGVALLQKMDPAAIQYLKKFAQEYQGRFFIKSAYQRMSYYYLIQGDVEQGKKYKSLILKVGSTEIDVDKQAERYARSAKIPDLGLLKANLASSGGFFSKALAELSKLKVSSLSDLDDMIEYYYRYGNVHGLMGNDSKAIPFYLNAVGLGTNSKAQFAARAALELALIYESQGKKQLATEYFKKCLAFKNHDFQSSIDQKAKAGLNRL